MSVTERFLRSLCLSALFVAPLVAQSDGDLDPGFGSNGTWAFQGDEFSYLGAATVAPDGRLVIAGGIFATYAWAVLDDDALGTPCSASLPGGVSFFPRDAAFDPQGRLLLAGGSSSPSLGNRGAVVRFLYPACDLDESFNLDGLYSSTLANSDFVAVAVDSAGRIVVAGEAWGPDDEDGLLVVRLVPGGLHDLSFALNGIFFLDALSPIRATSMTVLGSNAVLTGAASSTGFYLLKLDSTGSPDTGFGGDGVVVATVEPGFGAVPEDLAVEPVGGKIVAAGASFASPDGRFAAVRLHGDGSPDLGFADQGVWLAEVWLENRVESMELQSDGKILLAGDASDPDDPFVGAAIVHRLLPDGDEDLGFGFLGAVAVFFEGGYSRAQVADTVLHGGRLVLVGRETTSFPGPEVGVAARLWSSLIFTDGFERGSTAGW